jgi:proline iminopeptidase
MGKHSENSLRRTPLLDLFPPIAPYSTGFMAVDEPHELYWEQCGNPDGVPVVYLHGGPGAGCADSYRQFFDPDYYRIILFDQRGAGRSTPHCCLTDNTTEALVRDIEQLREHLSIDKWHVFGGSWGATLALSYAAEHPGRILSMVLRGIFLMEKQGIDWLLYDNKNVFPEAWEQFVSLIPEEERGDLLEAYYKRLTGDDDKVKLEAAISWNLYESSCASLIPNYEIVTTDEQKAHALAISTIECHYFRNNLIQPENSLLNKVDRFRHIPSIIVQGRYDMVCPILSAHQLHNVWPEADYIVVPDGGHSALDPAIRSRLVEATETVKTLLR